MFWGHKDTFGFASVAAVWGITAAQLAWGIFLHHCSVGSYRCYHPRCIIIATKPPGGGKSLVCIPAAQLVGSQHLPSGYGSFTRVDLGVNHPFCTATDWLIGDKSSFLCSRACCINCMGKLATGGLVWGKRDIWGAAGPGSQLCSPSQSCLP